MRHLFEFDSVKLSFTVSGHKIINTPIIKNLEMLYFSLKKFRNIIKNPAFLNLLNLFFRKSITIAQNFSSRTYHNTRGNTAQIK